MKKKVNKFIKIITYLTIVILTLFSLKNIYATCTCNINLEASETTVKKGDTFTIDVNISDIQSEIGIMAFGATVDYDRSSLNIEKIEGLNNWETPANGSSYNVENGKIAITKSGFGKEDETIIRITFGVTEKSKKDLDITLKEISLSDGTGLAKVDDISKNITVKNGSNSTKKSGGKGIIISLVVVLAVLGFIIFKNKRK